MNYPLLVNFLFLTLVFANDQYNLKEIKDQIIKNGDSIQVNVSLDTTENNSYRYFFEIVNKSSDSLGSFNIGLAPDMEMQLNGERPISLEAPDGWKPTSETRLEEGTYKIMFSVNSRTMAYPIKPTAYPIKPDETWTGFSVEVEKPDSGFNQCYFSFRRPYNPSNKIRNAWGITNFKHVKDE